MIFNSQTSFTHSSCSNLFVLETHEHTHNTSQYTSFETGRSAGYQCPRSGMRNIHQPAHGPPATDLASFTFVPRHMSRVQTSPARVGGVGRSRRADVRGRTGTLRLVVDVGRDGTLSEQGSPKKEACPVCTWLGFFNTQCGKALKVDTMFRKIDRPSQCGLRGQCRQRHDMESWRSWSVCLGHVSGHYM